MSRLSIRWRLTLWYGGVLAGVLAVFGASVFFLMRAELGQHARRVLSHQATAIEQHIERLRGNPQHRRRLAARLLLHPDYEIQISGLDGEVWTRSARLGDQGLPAPGTMPEAGEDRFDLFSPPGMGQFRMISRVTEAQGTPLLIQVATSLAENERQLRELMAILLLAGSLAVACALGGGYLLARQALAPVDRMTAAAEAITATQLDRRIEVHNRDDELGRLARTLNRMIERLGRSLTEVRRFTADAAHELRTPLAILRNEAEVALRIPRESEQYRDCLEDMLEEIDHLSRLSEALLFLFREDAGPGSATRELLALDELVREATDHMRVVAAEKCQQLALEPPPRASVLGNPQQLRRLLFNLLENAIKFTPEGGNISLNLECAKDSVRVIVADTGIGIAAEHLPRVFDRFYRVDAARSRRTGGNGLGLAICRSIAEAHGGTIDVQSQPDCGTRVIVTLPGAIAMQPRRPDPEPLAATAQHRSSQT
jgi:heavy metal sensor kinase